MSKSKKNRFFEDRSERYSDYVDYNEYDRTKEDKMRNKRKERRIEHAIRTKNVDELLEAEDEWDFD